MKVDPAAYGVGYIVGHQEEGELTLRLRDGACLALIDLAKEDSRTGAALVGNFDDQGRLIMVRGVIPLPGEKSALPGWREWRLADAERQRRFPDGQLVGLFLAPRERAANLSKLSTWENWPPGGMVYGWGLTRPGEPLSFGLVRGGELVPLSGYEVYGVRKSRVKEAAFLAAGIEEKRLTPLIIISILLLCGGMLLGHYLVRRGQVPVQSQPVQDVEMEIIPLDMPEAGELPIGPIPWTPEDEPATYYEVRPGDNLWRISREILGKGEYYRRLQEENDLSDPHLIHPGQKLKLPADGPAEEE
ncbi:MAG: LysM peptidoglycan-binding domain-containing protein [Limnochordia bacterium]|nr:LysM peptidoglycan-binding domain-containing protein [Bacillota bacterium]